MVLKLYFWYFVNRLENVLLIVAAGLAGCSSSRSATRSDGNAELDDAAVAACGWLWANRPDAKEREYCGVLYRSGASAAIEVGLPQAGKTAKYSCFPDDPPAKATLLGRYHNHRFEAEPSRDDKRRARKEPGLSHYLCGPSGIVRRFSAEEGTVNVR